MAEHVQVQLAMAAVQCKAAAAAMQCIAAAAAAPSEILAAEPVKDANFSCEFGTSASAREILPTNLNELERLRGVLRCSEDGKQSTEIDSKLELSREREMRRLQHPAG